MKITVILPVHNGATTLVKTLGSLLKQSLKFDELIVIDDASTDASKKTIQEYLDGKSEYKLVEHQKNLGLAKTYNEGIRIAVGNLIITLHQDVVLLENSLQKLIEPFGDDEVVATSHIVIHPIEIWKTYNFWQKCFFARLVGKKFSGMDGKFDCFRKTALEKVGMFDENHFRTAGEDGDLIVRLKKIGRIVQTNAEIIHLHRIDDNFSWRDIVYKQKQCSEAQGALLALGRIKGLTPVIRTFFREILVLTLFIPRMDRVSLILIISYSFLYTKPIYFEEYKNPKILLLPLFNIYLLFVSFFYSLRGFFYGKQRI